jgi:uncharacterized protein YgiM (DUF1202 family)
MKRILATASALVTAVALSGAAAANPAAPPLAGAPTAIAAADMQMMVASTYANLREKPSTSSKILTKLSQGTKVDVMEKASGGRWLHVRANNMEGYIDQKLVK